jgi:Family of unknown function (DUF6297)
MTVTREAIAVPDSTEPTISLLRELRRGRARRQAASAAYWIYVVALLVALYGGTQIASAFHDLRHPPPPSAQAPRILHAAPPALAALALLVLLLLLRDALWRGPVTLPQVTVDWLLDTPVDRGRLLRPRFRISAAATVAAGAAVGIVPAAALVALGLGGHSAGHVLRLIGIAMTSTALLFALGTGAAGLIERQEASAGCAGRPRSRSWSLACAGLAAWAAFGQPPGALTAVALWSGPWGWATQGMTALAGGTAPWWPLATALLGAAALCVVACAHRAAAGVPGSALRIRARTIGAMSAAALSMDARGVALAYRGAAGSRRARFRLPPPRRRELVLPWRDLLALGRAPSRLLSAAALELLAVGLIVVAGLGGQLSLVPVASGLTLGYLAAAWLCEGARLDAEDTRRSENLPFRFGSLAWWHAAVPCLVLLAVAAAPVIVVAAATGDPQLIALLAVTIPVLVAGALVNVFRARFPPDLFDGVETPLGNTAAIQVILWLAWGPVLAVAPLTVLLVSAVRPHHPGALVRAVVVGGGLAAGLGAYAARRAHRLWSA